MLLRARVVLPMTRPPIDDGAVWISGNRIRTVGRRRDLAVPSGEPVVDLGDAILLPGLINAHCHLDYTDMAGEIAPARLFTDWIKTITTAKSGMIYADFAQSWMRGAQMLLRSGTTTVADIEAVPELLPEVWQATPLRVFSFLELTGVKSRREPQLILDEAVQTIESLPASRGGAGLSPHAPYSTTPELLRLSAATARARLGSPVEHLERNGYLDDNLIAVHANYLAPGDAALLAKRGVSVAHCPRSHAFFQHCRFPREELAGAGVNLCLGTDSLASVATARGRPLELNLIHELQACAAAHPDLPPEEIVRLATVNGARALGMQGKIGELAENFWADLIAIPFAGNLPDAFDAVVHHNGAIAASMIDGEWAITWRDPA